MLIPAKIYITDLPKDREEFQVKYAERKEHFGVRFTALSDLWARLERDLTKRKIVYGLWLRERELEGQPTEELRFHSAGAGCQLSVSGEWQLLACDGDKANWDRLAPLVSRAIWRSQQGHLARWWIEIMVTLSYRTDPVSGCRLFLEQ